MKIIGETVSQFQQAMEEAGIRGAEEIISDGQIHRFPVEGDKPGDKNGWYVFYDDDVSAGAFGSWKTGFKKKWCSQKPLNLSEEERIAWHAKVRAAQQARDGALAQLREDAAQKARGIWEKAAQVEKHPYLDRKHVQAHGLKLDQDSLVVPLHDVEGTLHSLQFIDDAGNKRFLFGGAIQGHFHAIGNVTKRIWIAEGYATAATVFQAIGEYTVVAFNTGNLKPVAQVIRKQYPQSEIVIVADNDQWTEGNPGFTKAKAAAEAIHAERVIPQFSNLDTEPTDFNDLLCLEGLEAVKQQLTEALTRGNASVNEPHAETTQQTLERLAGLSTLDYAQQRQRVAKNLGVSLPFLDKAVKEAKAKNGGGKPLQGQEIAFPEIPPVDEFVDGKRLLASLTEVLTRYVVLPVGAAVAIALWIFRSFAHDLFETNPRLAVRSPEKQCGKTTLLEVLSMLVPKPLLTSNCTPASIFRVIEQCQPTLLADEMDSFQNTHEELRGILNSGHTKAAARVIRTVGDNHEPRAFSTWCPMALAAIGTLPDTLEDRSIRIDLQRKKKSDRVQRLPRKGSALKTLRTELEELQRQCVRWVIDHTEQLAGVELEALPELADRANDNWHGLLSIAAVIGGEWSEKARKAALQLSEAEPSSETIGVQLLIDCHAILKDKQMDVIPSLELCDALTVLDESPWPTFSKGKPISQHQLARKLRIFKIATRSIRGFDGSIKRGYLKEEISNAFDRYCPPSPGNPLSECYSATTPMDTGDNLDFQSATEESCSSLQNNTLANARADCSSVAVQKQELRGREMKLGTQTDMAEVFRDAY